MRAPPRPIAAALLGGLLHLFLFAPGAGAAEPPPAGAPGAAPVAPDTGATPPEPWSPVDPKIVLDNLAAQARAAADGEAELAGPPSRLPVEWEDDKTRAAYLKAVRAYYEYRGEGLRHRGGVFAWQLGSSKVIFVVMVLLVLSGVYFSGVQFHSTLRGWKLAADRQAAGEAAAGPSQDALGGELEAGLDHLKVRSPVLGVIILALSFLFFYLYIVHVHPIQEIL